MRECTIFGKAKEFSVGVRMGEVETLKEAGSRGAGLRVLIGKRMGSSYTSDLTPEGIRQMVLVRRGSGPADHRRSAIRPA